MACRRLALIIVAAVMLFVAFAGFCMFVSYFNFLVSLFYAEGLPKHNHIFARV